MPVAVAETEHRLTRGISHQQRSIADSDRIAEHNHFIDAIAVHVTRGNRGEIRVVVSTASDIGLKLAQLARHRSNPHRDQRIFPWGIIPLALQSDLIPAIGGGQVAGRHRIPVGGKTPRVGQLPPSSAVEDGDPPIYIAHHHQVIRAIIVDVAGRHVLPGIAPRRRIAELPVPCDGIRAAIGYSQFVWVTAGIVKVHGDLVFPVAVKVTRCYQTNVTAERGRPVGHLRVPRLDDWIEDLENVALDCHDLRVAVVVEIAGRNHHPTLTAA